MAIDISDLGNKRIIIIEGIAGSGKDTFQKQLSDHYTQKGFIVYNFSEEELLFSWKHFWIKNIEMHRIHYLHSLLDYCVKLIKENPKTIITLNRFHITYAIFSKFNRKAKKLYDVLMKRLRKLPVHIFIGKLEEREIQKRALHSERKEKIWKIHQKKRLKEFKFDSLLELYKAEQNIILKIAQKQKIPFSFIKVQK